MIVLQVLSLVLIGAGAFFLAVGSIGIVRLPDFFTRTHAVGKSDTLGLILTLSGIAIHEGFTINSAKLLAAVVFVALTSPVGTHALARAAYRSGLRPWYVGGPPPKDPTAPSEEAAEASDGAEEERE